MSETNLMHSVFREIKAMTEDQEKLVEFGCCPNCVPAEGTREKMNRLGDFGQNRAYRCKLCNTVWVIAVPFNPGEFLKV